MSTFIKGGGISTPWGKNQYLRSTRGLKFESYTLAAGTVPSKTIDGNPNQKILQPGTVMAKITSGPDAGKIGPFQAGATDGRQTLANAVGINDTFLPWQTIERDVEIGVLYDGTCIQAWCIELDSSGNSISLTNTTADGLRGTKRLSVTFA